MIQINKLWSMLCFETLLNNGFYIFIVPPKNMSQVSLQAALLFFLLTEGSSEHLHQPPDSQLSVKAKLSGQILGCLIKFY